MPYNGSGVFQRTFPVGGWQGDASGSIRIRADRHDQHDADLASGLSTAICRDGQSLIIADIPFNNKKITGLATPTAATDAATKAYVDTADVDKEPIITVGTTAQYYRGDKSWATHDKASVGLGSVDNTADASKPVSTATSTALALKANLASPSLTGVPLSITAATATNTTQIATTAFVQANMALAVLKTGSTMTGDLTISKTLPVIFLDKTAGSAAQYQFKHAASLRWVLEADGTAESSGNVGTAFNVRRYSDTGVYIDSSISIARATGNVTILNSLVVGPNTVGGDSQIMLNKTASGDNAYVSGAKGGVNRWAVELGDNAVESTGNAGSNFGIHRYNDAGTYIDTPLSINRATGVVSIPSIGSGFQADLDLVKAPSYSGVSSGGGIVQATTFPFQIQAANGLQAAVSFHIAGTFAMNFGLASDGNLYEGGWSHGAVAWPILSTRNFLSLQGAITGTYSVGSYLYGAVPGQPNTAVFNPGTQIAGAYIQAAGFNTYDDTTWASGAAIPGTWLLMGYLVHPGGVAAPLATLTSMFLRIA